MTRIVIIVIIAAKRTPIGTFTGGLKDVSTVDLKNLDGNDIDDVIVDVVF